MVQTQPIPAAAAPSLTQTPPPLRPAKAGYFEQSWPAAVILGTFFAITLPMAAITLFAPNAGLVTWVYVWLFGITHFVVTLSIYCNSANLKYFASTWKTVAIFFLVPALIFITFDLIHALRMKAAWPLAALVFFGAVRFFDFFHLNRQTFGVLQMFKGRTKLKYAAELRTHENRYLISMVALLFTTFLGGGVCPLLQAGGALSLADLPVIADGVRVFDLTVLQFAWVALTALCVALFVRIVRSHLAMMRANPQSKTTGAALTYLVFQSLGTVLAAFYFPLYLASLAIHYVEYHILMVPRCLHSPMDDTSRVDRTWGWLRSRPILLYTGIVGLSAIVAGGAFVGMNAAMGAPIIDFESPVSYLVLIALFDGIFVFHYFVEMFIWKFSDPHFRKMLNGLYFSPAPKPA